MSDSNLKRSKAHEQWINLGKSCKGRYLKYTIGNNKD